MIREVRQRGASQPNVKTRPRPQAVFGKKRGLEETEEANVCG